MEKHLLVLMGTGGLSTENILISLNCFITKLSIIFYTNKGKNNSEKFKSIWKNSFSGAWVDVENQDEIVDCALKINQDQKIDGVLTFSEFSLKEQAQIAHILKLPGNHPKSVEKAQSKILQRKILEKSKIANPLFYEIQTINDIQDAAKHVGFPGVLKPSHGASSFLVSYIEDLNKLYLSVGDAFSHLEESPLQGNRTLVYEKFLEGEKRVCHGALLGDYVSVESIIQNGEIFHITVLDKLAIKEPFIEEGSIIPSNLPQNKIAQIFEYASSVISAIGLTAGATHMEIKVTNDGPVLLEINARVGGPTASLLLSSSNYNIIQECAKVALGIPILKHCEIKNSALARYMSFPSGVVKLIHQEDKNNILERFPEVKFLNQRFKIGDTISRDGPGIQSSGVSTTFLAADKNIEGCLKIVEQVEKALGCTWEQISMSHFKEQRPHVLILDRVGFFKYRSSKDGTPFISSTDYDISIICSKENVSKIKKDEVSRIFPIIDLTDYGYIEDIVCKINSIKPIQKICAFAEIYIILAAKLRDKLGLSENQEDLSLRVRDKIIMKKKLEEHGIRVPKFALASEKNIYEHLNLYGKIVVKPIRGSGSQGLYFIHSYEDAKNLIEKLKSEIEKYEVEEYIEGEVLHIDSIVQNEEIIWSEVSAYCIPPYRFLQGEADYGYALPKSQKKKKLIDFNISVINALQINNSVTHHECIYTPEGEIVFCEIAGRAGGGEIVPFLEYIHGVNLYQAMFDLQLGHFVQVSKEKDNDHIVGFIGFPIENGTLLQVPKETDFCHPTFLEYKSHVTLGEKYASPLFGHKTAARILLQGKNIEELMDGFTQLKKQYFNKTKYSLFESEKIHLHSIEINETEYLNKMQNAFEKRYENNRDSWTNDPATIPLTDKLVSYLPEPTEKNPIFIVDIGCGRGKDVERFLKLNYHSIGVDLVKSPEWDEISSNYPSHVTFIKNEFTEWFPTGIDTFDAVLDNGCFHHQHPEHIPKYFSHLHKILKINGIFALTLFAKGFRKEVTQPHFFEKDGALLRIEDGRFSKEYHEIEVSKILNQNGFQILYIERINRPRLLFENLSIIAKRIS